VLWRFVILAHVNRAAKGKRKTSCQTLSAYVNPEVIDFLSLEPGRVRCWEGWKKKNERERLAHIRSIYIWQTSVVSLSVVETCLPSTIFDVICRSNQPIVTSTHDRVLDTVRGFFTLQNYKYGASNRKKIKIARFDIGLYRFCVFLLIHAHPTFTPRLVNLFLSKTNRLPKKAICKKRK